MNHKILIRNFGPIKDAEIHLNNNFQILIGSQASGKSTLCKIVYFCQKIRDYTLEFLMNSEQFTKNHKNEYFNNYLKYMTKQFIGCFGTTKHMQKFRITYLFDEKKIEICLNNDGYVRFSFNDILKMEIYSLIEEASDMFLNRLNNEVASIMDNITAIGVMKRHLTEVLFSIFKNEAEIIYIPAGRSLLATMSEQLHDISVSEMDLTMQEFVKLIRATKSQFGTKIPEMVQNYTKTVKGQINNSAVTHAYELIKKILKADYVNDSDGEKIYFDEHHWVKLMYGSSGQQEAHLFPIAQKDMISLIALMVNATDSRVIITTHSPYILTSSNILLYSEKVENNYRGEEKPVIPRSIRLSYHKFAAYKVENAADSLTSLMDENSHMISTDYIDKVSEITNNELVIR